MYARAPHLLPLSTQHSEVALVTPLSVLLSGGEELVGLFRELLCYGSEADLTLEVVLELIPLRLFAIPPERVLPSAVPDYSARGALCGALGGSAASLPRHALSARVARTPHTPRHPAPSGLCHTLHQQGCSLGAFNLRLVNNQ